MFKPLLINENFIIVAFKKNFAETQVSDRLIEFLETLKFCRQTAPKLQLPLNLTIVYDQNNKIWPIFFSLYNDERFTYLFSKYISKVTPFSSFLVT